MNTTAIVVIAAAVLVGAVAAAILYHRRGGQGEIAYRQKEAELRKTLRQAEKDHRQAIKAAEKRLNAEQKTYAAVTGKLAKELEDLLSPDGRRLGSYQNVVLHELTISTPQGKSGLVGASAAVDTAGNLSVTRRATLTRTVAGGVIFGPVGAIIGGA